MSQHSYHHHKAGAAMAQVPFSFGGDIGPLSPIMSAPQQAAYRRQMGNVQRPFGGYIGCGYTEFGDGIICQHNPMNKYHPNAESFYSRWTGNVNYPYGPDFPQPDIKTPGGIDQIMMGGGAGRMNNPCANRCSCENDFACTCMNDGGDSPGVQCGWPSVSHNCMEPVPGGKYPSLHACEAATATGAFGGHHAKSG
jgi:hypothetical protein